MNVIFLVKVMLFVRISIETPPHHPYFSSSHLCIACEKHLHDSNEILFPLMKTSAAMNEKPTKKRKKKRGKFEKTTRIYIWSRSGRWNAVQMEGVCTVIGKEK